MAVQTEKISGTTTREPAARPGGRVLQAAVPLVGLLAATAAGLGVVSVIGTGGDGSAPLPTVSPTVVVPLPAVGPNVREGRVSLASSCPPLLDGHPSHRVVRTWVCPTR